MSVLFPKSVLPDTERILIQPPTDTVRVRRTQSPHIYNWRIPFIAITVSGDTITTELGVDITTESGDELVTE